jgi:hypothetical protein
MRTNPEVASNAEAISDLMEMQPRLLIGDANASSVSSIQDNQANGLQNSDTSSYPGSRSASFHSIEERGGGHKAQIPSPCIVVITTNRDIA